MDACGPILVLDPDDRCRDVVAALLERLGYEVRKAASAAEAWSMTEEAPELVVLEVDLPDASGYEFCRECQERYGADLPVIFIAGRRTDSSDRIAGLLLGADDYVAKPFEPDELLARVRRSLRRSRLSPRVAGSLSGQRRLTPRETQILGLLTLGLSQKEIASELVISHNTVGTHIQRLLGKLDVHNRAQAVAVALRERIV
ncbi:MAG TPA: response regulator transcription factor [Gaiellaceae bacterium]|nr:response regulator transcription factor [Gaiellaceae bacterium]